MAWRNSEMTYFARSCGRQFGLKIKWAAGPRTPYPRSPNGNNQVSCFKNHCLTIQLLKLFRNHFLLYCLFSLFFGSIFVYLFYRAKTFHMPEDGTVPIIMVGPGTGIAPFRSFWQQRQFDVINKPAPKAKTHDVTPDSSPLPRRRVSSPAFSGNSLNPSSNRWGTMVLFFGCRDSKQDFIYKDELARVKDDGALTQVFLALSREPQQPKVTVMARLFFDTLTGIFGWTTSITHGLS